MTLSAVQGEALGVLVSGGVESAAMLYQGLEQHKRVTPIYVRKGLHWESAELISLKRLLKGLQNGRLSKLVVLEMPIQPILQTHWSVRGQGIPGERAPDKAVFLPGRNLLLLSLAGLFCSMHQIPRLWVGILKGNPFRDARPQFLRQVEQLVHQASGCKVRIQAPLQKLTKAQVIRRWPQVAWVKTFSCLKPVGQRHCGHCQKCAERKRGFLMAGQLDPTQYGRR